ncbi:MAG TPA: hypothetical protein VFZ12_05935, partial [Dehalococcoidia bacterium]|nr:hypothetical protein [Dehalococcoidia bacterium]
DLPDSQIEKAARQLKDLNDPLSRLLEEAEEDDEPLTEEDLKAIEEAHEDIRQGRVVSHEEARRRLLG